MQDGVQRQDKSDYFLRYDAISNPFPIYPFILFPAFAALFLVVGKQKNSRFLKQDNP
jgi:phenylalanine-4-hydroxylase